ncbi:MAG: hypothetical protein KF809_01255 [Chloroflexi bacterium]|nr:hypothetical protein [Chloroflexota bacterium]
MRARKSGLRATARPPAPASPVAPTPPTIAPRSAEATTAAATTSTAVAAADPDEPPAESFDAVREPIEPLRSGGFGQVGGVIGGVIAGIEQQVFGRKPPGEVEIRQVQPARGLTNDGSTVTLEFPDRDQH